MSDSRRSIPSVSSLLETAAVKALLDEAPRPVVLSAIRDALSDARVAGAARDSWEDAVRARFDAAERASLRPVINATGVVLHTNLGRAPLADAAIAAMARVASGFSNLEYDLNEGERGSRYSHCASLLTELTGAEDALVVNNGAAALVLALNTVADGRQAVISRGELVEIGGSFRVRDIMAKSGALLREVGSTNRTHEVDFNEALSADTGAVVRIHRSNFSIEGFVAEVGIRELAAVAHSRSVPLLHDLGSGLMMPLDAIGLHGEPTARQALGDGADIVTMSGDKLLGGPQAGIILGSKALLARMRANPLARSYRVDKFTLAALEATLSLYRDPARALSLIPALAMLGETRASIEVRANEVLQELDCEAHIVDSIGSVGAGAYPTAKLESSAIVLHGAPSFWAEKLRVARIPIVGRTTDDVFMLDFRAIRPFEHAQVVRSVNAVAKERASA